MDITGSTALVTGANRGIGRAFVEELQQAGAARIYATARDVSTLAELASGDPQRVVPVPLDITDEGQIRDAAAMAGDVNLLVNNAGVAKFAGLIRAENLDAARTEMETNYFGALAMIRAFAPILGANGGGAIVNVLSIASRVNFPMLGSYSASKAAAHSMTQGVRAELSDRGTLVVGVYPGPVETDMVAGLTMPKAPPAEIVRAALEAVITGLEEVYPDPMATELRDGLASDPKSVEKRVAAITAEG
ncbi:MAG: SDR family oxidoreductase [Alphaproteobacteria bacterium]